MNTNPSETTDIDIVEVRRRMNEVKAAEGLTWGDIENGSGVKKGTLSTFATDKYAGDNERVAAMVQRWLQSREAAASVAATLPSVPGFRPTPSATEILSVLRYAQAAPGLCVIVGVPGIGKTSTFDYYRETTSNVFKITLEPNVKTVYGLLTLMCETLGVSEKNAAMLSRRIQATLEHKDALIIVDEAQHATMDVLEQLRAFSDTARVGLVLGGNHSILTKIAGGSARGRYAQLSSRVDMKVILNTPRRGDVEALADAWDVSADEERGFLHRIAGKPGGLRNITKMIRIATLLAQGEEVERRLKHLRQAWRQLSSDDTA